MTVYEYKVVPAPSKGRKAAGVKGPEARFAHGLQEALNEVAAGGWEYQRADILPSEERQGLTSTQTVYRSVLVFRRAVLSEAEKTQENMTPVQGVDAESTADFTQVEDFDPSEYGKTLEPETSELEVEKDSALEGKA